MILNLRLIVSLLGILLAINAIFMWICVPISLYYADGQALAILAAGGLCGLIGGTAFYFTRQASKNLRKRDGYLIVSAGWLMLSLTGTFPYLFSGAIGNFSDAFFETISGYTTTGATILTDIEALPEGVLFWRSLTQWIGGMGIVVLTVAIFPILGIGGMQLFVAEAPGISPDKLQPRIKETAKRLWFIYVGLTFAEAILLRIGGMSWFDAANHALTTMATGGFSTKNASIAAFSSPFIQYTITFFMLLAGVNFTMLYFIMQGIYKKVLRNEEFLTYLTICFVAALVVATGVFVTTDYGLEASFRTSLFHVVSIVTTTGYVVEDYTLWSPMLVAIFVLLMFVGGSAGSTAGGVKVSRHIVLIKNSFLELRRQLHPSAVMPVHFHGKALSEHITFNILAFIIIYILIFCAGMLVLSLFGMDFMSAMGASATSLGNIGPGFGSVGPVDNFASVPVAARWIMTLLMLLGRLELFTVMILFTAAFWRRGG